MLTLTMLFATTLTLTACDNTLYPNDLPVATWISNNPHIEFTTNPRGIGNLADADALILIDGEWIGFSIIFSISGYFGIYPPRDEWTACINGFYNPPHNYRLLWGTADFPSRAIHFSCSISDGEIERFTQFTVVVNTETDGLFNGRHLTITFVRIDT